MEVGGTLQILAEVAIAIAGFSGVVSALNSRAAGAWAQIDKERLSFLLQTSLSVTFFSLLPLVLFSTGIEASTIWAATSGVWLVYMIATLPSLRRRLRRVGPAPDRLGRPLLILALGILTLVALLQCLNAAVLRLAWPHLVALLWGLVLASLFFVRLVQSLWSDNPPAA